jgi:hypothetical protein
MEFLLMWRIVFVLLLVCQISVFAQTVIEDETKIVIKDNVADIALAIENPKKSLTEKISLELLDIKGIVQSQTSVSQTIKQGKEVYKLQLPLENLLEKNQADFVWFRIRYKVGENHGIISLNQIIRDFFEIRVIASDELFSGMTYKSRIRATNPFNQNAVEGVKLKANLDLELKDEQKMNLVAESQTDAEGFADFEFQIPIGVSLDDGKLKVEGKKNGIVREATEDLRGYGDDYNFPMMTDKPIYQPEQMLNIRGILLKGTEGKVVVPNADVEFRIEDEDETVLYREKTKTSEFGVASIAWKIPENAKLGKYRIRVKNQLDDESEYVGYQDIKVSRYDLPNFAVNAKALKAYYLPNENEAEVEVSADYLFGKPVIKGKVRVVRETERKWNYKEQKYDIEEGESHDGKTDENGKFTAKFDLKDDHEKLKDDDYGKFRDLNFTAYFTDLTTNRTEQRRFDVRISKEPIHVYFIGERYGLNANLSINAYVSAFYADGSPCVCDIELKGRKDDSDEKFKTILKTKTNSLGGGRLNFMRPKFEDLDDDLDIKIIAKDEKGLVGTYSDEDGSSYYDKEINFEDRNSLQIETEKTIFKAGDSIKVKLNAAFEQDTAKYSPRVYVDIVKDWSVVDSYFVDLKDGKGQLKIPYNEKFQGVLTISAYFQEDNEIDGDLVRISRGIIYPHSENLKVEANFDKETYKPSEEAKVSFNVLDSIGQAVNSALGVVIFDKAVEERAKSEGDFNGTFKNYYGWLGYGDSFSGINIKDLNDLDTNKPISDELQLAAEIMLYDEFFSPNIFHSNLISPTDAKSIFADYFKKQFEPIEKKLDAHYKLKNFEHPQDIESFQRILTANDINFDDLRDPWEQKYRVAFSIEKENDVVKITSSGVDEKFDTEDDFIVSSSSFRYFAPTANAIDKALKEFHTRTGDYIRDEKTLFKELGISELKDRFGRPYQIGFYVETRLIMLRIWSLGSNGKTMGYDYYDDFEIYKKGQNYFEETEKKISEILSKTQKIPRNEDELKSLLKTNGVDLDKNRDGYGEKVYLFKREFSRYENVYKEEIVSEYGKEGTTTRKIVTPVTQGFISFRICSKGADKKENTSDDFTLAEFQKVIWEQNKDDKQPVSKPISYKDGTGSIQGTIKDPNGALIPGVTVTATNSETFISRSTTTNDEGTYLIGNLEAGSYSIKFVKSGFMNNTITGIKIKANNTIEVNVEMKVSGAVDTVTVTTGATVVETSSSQVSTVNSRNFQDFATLSPSLQIDGSDKNSPRKDSNDTTFSQKSTPKLREYFPETLVWQPELITNADGKAELKFKMADNITTWKIYTIASTKNGKFGIAEKEVTAFQPFFVDLEPPKFLTEGDEIYLPTQVRNYTPTKQKVDVTMSKSDWFSFLTPDLQKIEVDKNSAKNAVFGFKAITPVKDGKQRVTAIATKDSDAIEKPVTVRPNGEEIVQTDSRLFTNSAQFEVNFPENMLPKTNKAELKIYPNLMSHVTESVEGLLQRPYGCGEQTISSTYPNLMLLKFIKNDNSLTKKAKKYLKSGYERLLGYQVSDGGFSYWGGKSDSDLALTAYALRFLNDAKSFIEVDEKVIENATNFLLKQQREDGSFYKKYYWETVEDKGRAKMTTTYIARTLAMLKSNKTNLDKALNYLKSRNSEIDEPYSLALYALASFDSGNLEEAEKTVTRLQNLAKSEGNLVYWNLETNTPFYGWGTAGRIETTALVIQALLKSKDQNPKNKDLISNATMFLLKNKDRYGVWYSTQTTINVLNTFLATLSEVKNQTISVSVNGEKLKDFEVSAEQIEPIILDLSDKLSSANRLEIRSSENSQVMTQIVKTHYIDWKDSVSTHRNVNDSRAIRLDYKCDKLQAKIMENINCSVEAERIGFQGYGMLLAEIGIPPGADVSRESLEKAFENDWYLSRYEVLPDRIIVYMWAKSGGSKFNFSFKPRYAINAQTPKSIIYDYYNEESRGVVSPLKFEVK